MLVYALLTRPINPIHTVFQASHYQISLVVSGGPILGRFKTNTCMLLLGFPLALCWHILYLLQIRVITPEGALFPCQYSFKFPRCLIVLTIVVERNCHIIDGIDCGKVSFSQDLLVE